MVVLLCMYLTLLVSSIFYRITIYRVFFLSYIYNIIFYCIIILLLLMMIYTFRTCDRIIYIFIRYFYFFTKEEVVFIDM